MGSNDDIAIDKDNDLEVDLNFQTIESTKKKI